MMSFLPDLPDFPEPLFVCLHSESYLLELRAAFLEARYQHEQAVRGREEMDWLERQYLEAQ